MCIWLIIEELLSNDNVEGALPTDYYFIKTVLLFS